MLFSWTLNNMSENISGLICLVIFFLSFIVAIIVLIILNINRLILQTIARTLDLINDLKKSPLRIKINRIAWINQDNGQFQTELDVWLTKYEIIFENQLVDKIQKFQLVIEQKKNTKPTLSNLKKFKKTYDQITQLNQQVHIVYGETVNLLEAEMVQRDCIITQIQLFSKLKDEVSIFSLRDFKIDINKLDQTLDKIEELFSDFFNFLFIGSYNKSWAILNQISEAIKFLIELLDCIPHVVSTNNVLIPDKMIKLKNDNVTFAKADRNKLDRNANKYADLEHNVDSLRIELNHKISKLQYKKARMIMDNIFKLISEFEIFVESEDSLKQFFDENIETIRRYIDEIHYATNFIEKSFNESQTDNKISSREKLEFEAAKTRFAKVKNSADIIFSRLDVRVGTDNNDYPSLKTSLLTVLKDALISVEELEKSSISAEKLENNIESIFNHTVWIQSVISQCRVKIDQYKSVQELEKFIPRIDKIQKNIEPLTHEYLKSVKNQEDKQKLHNHLEKLNEEIMGIVYKINDCIFLDFISQELMIYLEKYVDREPEIEKTIVSCQTLFMQRNLDQLIGYALNVLNKLKIIYR